MSIESMKIFPTKKLGRSSLQSGSMYVKLLLSNLLLHLLILLISCYGTRSEDIAGGVLNNGRDHDHYNARADMRIEQVHSHSSPHMHHLDPAIMVFFFLEDLKLGNTMPIYFPKRELPDAFGHLLSKEEADSIPFSSQHLHNLLHLFSFSPGSPQAKAMKDTLDECERRPIKGETKFCATSWESMSDFLHKIFGLDTQMKSLSTTHIKRSDDALLHKYTIVGFRQIPAPKMVSCHTMPYAYAVFYCHYQDSENRVYRVSLTAGNGDKVDAVAVCHMDTSQWGRNHVAFKVLGIEPGSSPVCHFFPADNLVWVPTTSSMQA